MSTQDRLGREGDSAHADDGHDREGGAGVGGLDPNRMRAMQRRWVQRKASRGGGEGGTGQAAIPQAGGTALGGSTQARMEKTLGADLSGVRVHTGGESAEAAESMGARAFTVGSDVHFNRGEFAPGSKEGDRLLAHELTHVVQGQKSGVQRKADTGDSDAADGDHEAGGHEVSEPGDPAEHEADAVGDHAAEALHGGGDKAGGKEGGGGGGGKKVAREAGGGEKPKIGEQSAGVSRKIHLAKKPSAPSGAPPAKGAPAPAAGGKDAAKGKDAAGGKPEAKPLPPNVVARIQSINKLLDKDINDRVTGVAVKTSQADIEQYIKDYAEEASVKELKGKFDAKKAAIEARFTEVMTASTAAVTKLDATKPGNWGAIDALAKDPAILNWIGHAMFPATHELTQAFVKARDAKMTEFGDHKKAALDKAKGEIKAAPDKSESRATIDAIFESAKPYLADKSPYHGAVVVQLQEAYIGKRESINAAELAEKEKQEKLQKQQQEEQQKKQAQPQAAEAKDAGGGGGGGKEAGKPADAKASKGAPAAAAPPQESKAAEVKPGDAKAAKPAGANPDEQKQPGKPESAASAPGSAPAPAEKKQQPPAGVTPPPAPVTAEAPKPAGAPPQAEAKDAAPHPEAKGGGEAKGPDASAAKPADAPAPEKKDAGAPAKPEAAHGPDEKKDAHGAEGAKAPGPEGAAPAPAEAEDPKAKELELKKEVAKARVHEYLAKIQGRSTIFSGMIEIANAGLTMMKLLGASTGVEIPEELLGMGKDGIQLMAKTHAFNAKLAAAMAEAEIDAAESVGEIDGLFAAAEMLHEEHSILIGRAEALQKVCIRCFEDRMKQAAGGGAGGAGKKDPDAKKHDKKQEAHGPEKHGEEGAEAEGEEKKEGAEEGGGLGDTFSAVMEGEDQKEQEDIGGFKMMANQAASVLDPLKALKAGLEIRTELKHMGHAKADVAAAEKALEEHLAAHGGTALPGPEKKEKKKK